MYDSAGKQVSRKNHWDTDDKKEQWGFGVTEAGEYTLKAIATGGSGDYALKLEVISASKK